MFTVVLYGGKRFDFSILADAILYVDNVPVDAIVLDDQGTVVYENY